MYIKLYDDMRCQIVVMPIFHSVTFTIRYTVSCPLKLTMLVKQHAIETGKNEASGLWTFVPIIFKQNGGKFYHSGFHRACPPFYKVREYVHVRSVTYSPRYNTCWWGLYTLAKSLTIIWCTSYFLRRKKMCVFELPFINP